MPRKSKEKVVSDRRQELVTRKELVELELDLATKDLQLQRMNRASAIVQSSVASQPVGTAFRGAGTGQAVRAWNPYNASSDDELRDLPKLRERAKDLDRNNPIASGIASTLTSNIISQGLKLRSTIDRQALKMTEKAAAEWEREVEKLWEMFVKESDAAGRLSFYEMQEVAFKSAVVEGDSFTLFPILTPQQRGPREYFRFKVLLIEADQVQNEWGQMDSDKLRGGIELGDFDRPKAYHVMTKRFPMEWKIVPTFGAASGRRNVLHFFRSDRPNQKRGMPMAARIITQLKQIGRYSESELMAAVTLASQTMFIKSANPDALEIGSAPLPWDSPDRPEYGLVPGTIQRLEQDEDVTQFTPQRPNPSYQAFMQQMLLEVAQGVNMPYELLIKKYEASYSASRGARIDADRDWRAKRYRFTAGWCQPIYEEWLLDCVAQGIIKAPGFLEDLRVRHAFSGAQWIGDSMGLLDPLKEVDASVKKIQNKLSTYTAETAALGSGSFDENIVMLATEMDLIAEHSRQEETEEDDDEDGKPSNDDDPGDGESGSGEAEGEAGEPGAGGGDAGPGSAPPEDGGEEES